MSAWIRSKKEKLKAKRDAKADMLFKEREECGERNG